MRRRPNTGFREKTFYNNRLNTSIMALKVKAKEQLMKIGKYADTYRFVMQPELYIALSQEKVIFHIFLYLRTIGTGFPL